MPRVPPVTNAIRAMTVLLAALLIKSCPCRTRVRRYGRPLLWTFHADRDAHAAADAQGRQPLLRLALLHLVQQADQDARARGADRMTERDGAAIDIDLGRI